MYGEIMAYQSVITFSQTIIPIVLNAYHAYKDAIMMIKDDFVNFFNTFKAFFVINFKKPKIIYIEYIC